MKKRGVLSLWKVIILVIVGILGVAGVAVLSLYLMGKFDKQYVEPENISFVEDVSEGAGYYNATLGQYEVSSDFSMTITTTTENVTERKVTLSLKDGVVQNGYISDGIITVPQEVLLNQPFTVTLNTEYNSNPQILEDWIVGGVSTLTARSSNVLLSAQTVTICVDVPEFSEVVLASDGYPKLFGTLEESEHYLQKVLAEDPLCISLNKQTKGLMVGNNSYDDRTFVRFVS